MTNRELEQRLADAVARTAPNDWEGVLSRCQTRKGNVIPMTSMNPKRKRKALAAACLAVLLAGSAGGLFYQQTQAVASAVFLDVNPSIELKVNRSEKVLACTPLNSDAAQVLFEMNSGSDLKGVQLDVAVNAIVGSLLRHGYLDGISSAILISVEDNDQARATRLQHELTGTVGAALQAQAASANVLGQTLTANSGLTQQAQKSSISTGKAALVNQAIALNSSLTFDQLALLSVEELKDLIESGAPGMPIGSEAARKAAEDYAGLAAESADIDPELDESPAYYKVDLYYTGYGKLEYKVDAYTGKVLTGQANIQQNTSTGVQIAEAEAKNAAMQYMAAQYPELSNSKIQDNDIRLAWEEGRQVYKVSFTCNDSHFEYEVNATTGAIMDWDTNYTQVTQDNTASTISNTSGANAVGNTSGAGTVSSTYIGQTAAKTAALEHAGFNESDVKYCNVWMDYDNGRPEHYEVEFGTSDTRYEYEVSLYSTTILKYEQKPYNSPSSTPSTVTNVIGEAAAKAAALNHAGLTEAQVSGLFVKRDYDNGRLEYDVDFWQGSTEYEYTIDGSSGAVLKFEKDVHWTAGSSSTDIGQAAAKAAALKHAGLSESQVYKLKVERDYEHGRLEYDVEFDYGYLEYEYTIDGATGAILEYEVDD